MRRKLKKLDGVQIASILILTFIVVIILVPFWNALVISFETKGAYAQKPFSWLPGEFTLSNYEYLFTNASTLITAYIATILITIIGTALGMAISTMGAYVFSRKFFGKKILFMLTIFTMYFGGGLIPTYIMIKEMGLLDTYTIVILMNLISVYNIIIKKNGFESVPMELQEAAMIDGANDLKIFAQVMLPLQKPLLATFSLFTAVGYWNSWYWPMLLLNSGKKTVLQLFLRAIINSASSVESAAGNFSLSGMKLTNTFSLGIQMASVFMVVLPIMLVYPFLQKYFVKGVMVGAVKM